MLQFMPAAPLGSLALFQRLGVLQQQQVAPVILRPVSAGGGSSYPPPTAGDTSTYTFTQSAASTLWTINHNLGTFPSVTTTDPNGHLILGDVTYVSSNEITVAFSQYVSGVAYLNH